MSAKERFEEIFIEAIEDGSKDALNKKYKFSQHRTSTLLHEACRLGLINHAISLLENNLVDVNILINKMSPLQCTISRFISCERDNLIEQLQYQIQIYNLLLENDRIDVNNDNTNSRPILHSLCCIKLRINELKTLLNHKKINVNKQYNYETPLMYACNNNNLEAVKLLIEHPDIDANVKDDGGHTAFYYVCVYINCDLDIIKLLISDPRVDVNIPDNLGMTAYSACLQNPQDCVEVIKILISDNRIDKNKVDDDNLTPLEQVLYESKQKIKYLLKFYDIDDIQKVLFS